ncbi:MAG TPA: hypothetical protein VIU12_23650 [Chryseolinea sp.]
MALFAFIAVIGLYQAQAQVATPGVDQREALQRERIRSGAASGELTRRETAQARHDQRSIRRTERRAKADGEVTRQERVQLEHKQNRASRQLRRDKHDAQVRPGA